MIGHAIVRVLPNKISLRALRSGWLRRGECLIPRQKRHPLSVAGKMEFSYQPKKILFSLHLSLRLHAEKWSLYPIANAWVSFFLLEIHSSPQTF